MVKRAKTLTIFLVLAGLAVLGALSSSFTYAPFARYAALLQNFDKESITAESYFIYDRNARREILSRSPDEVRPIASVSKLFTAHVVTRSERIDDDALIVWQDFATEGTAGSLWLGEEYTVRELLFPLLLSSSNDAGAAIMRTLGRSYFTDTLAKIYEDAGLQHTTITDPTGLTAQNRSTARELARFLEYLDVNDSYVIDITTLRSYLGEYRGWINNDPGRKYESFSGGKHGYTPAAGRTFAGLFDTDEGSYVVVLLGSSDLEGDIDRAVSLLP